jgi:S1-C subfamily serine protease
MTGKSSQRGGFLAWVVILVAAMAAAYWMGGRERAERALAKIDAAPRAVLARGDLAADEQANIEVFRTASPSVVNVTTLQNTSSFFSLDVTQVPRGTGTGFMWDERGHVVTNFHVIQGGDAARITLADQSVYKAALVGAYPDRDIAVLRIDAPKEKLRPLALGESKSLVVGQKVFAIGNPFGLDQTLTTGIVSALNREIESVTRRLIPGVIQTDAAINPGNSGGPLLDSAGRLIGVNTAIFSPSGASAGIGFAIPVDEVNRIVPRLIRDGRVLRPTLGVGVAPPGFTEQLGLPQGVAVLSVEAGGPAATAGLKPFMRARDGGIIAGDVIIAIDGKPTPSFDRMLDALEGRQPGETAQLKLWREGKEAEVAVRLGLSDEGP